MKEKPLVSVIVPTYNRAKLLRDALGSVYAQEGIGEAFDIEVIVVDDASSDTTPEIVQDYPNIVYIRLPTNRGQSAAMNAGIKASRGKYVAILGDDDLFLPNRIISHIPVLEANPDIGAAYSQLKITGVETPYVYPAINKAPSGWVFRHFLIEGIFFVQITTIRREALEVAGYFDENLRTMEDYDLGIRLAFHVPFIFIPGVVFTYRFSEGGNWFSNLVKHGFEETVPYILDKVLTLVPEKSEALEMKKKASLSFFWIVASTFNQSQRIDRLRNYLFTTLQRNPWIMQEPWAWDSFIGSIKLLAGALASSSNSVIHELHAFCREISAIPSCLGLLGRRHMKQRIAQIWMATGAALKGMGSPGSRRKAGYATVCAVLNDFSLIRQKYVWKMLARGIVFSNSCWDPIVMGLKKRLGTPTNPS